MNPLIRRLVESAPSANLSEVRPVVMAKRTVEVMQCPHCQQEILEKHIFEEGGVDHHRDCGGAIQLPGTDWSKVSADWQFLKDYAPKR